MKHLSKIMGERTSFDGMMLIGICGCIILFGGVAKMLAWAGLGWGIWTLLKSEK